MKVALDAQLAIGTATGIGEYVRGLSEALRREGVVDVVELAAPGLDPWRFDRRVLWDQVLLPRRARGSHADVLHCASGTVPLRTHLPVVATVHDVAWLRVQSHARPYARYYFGPFSVERYRNVAQIVVDSEFSRRELASVLGSYDQQRVRVVYPGVAEEFGRLQRADGDRRTILVVGTVERRKNLDAMIRLLPRLEGARIVSVGPATPYLDECRALARTLDVVDRVEFRGYVTRPDLLTLYATCAVVAVPSRYEGFGYAAAQALCAGAPCIVSDRGALAEIVGTDAPIIPLDDSPAWKNAIEFALSGADDPRAAGIRARAVKRYSWSAAARQMEAVYQAAMATTH
ncbi:MAG: glycosyltransferase [Candidatus Tumulicola sp.]